MPDGIASRLPSSSLMPMSDTPADNTSANPSYYERHIFFCINQRDNGESCCAQFQAQTAFERCKSQAKALGLLGPGQVRVNKAGCLDRCAAGPVAVVYPEAVWYTYLDDSDIDEIVQSHLRDGVVVQRLLTPPHLGR
ncbi:MAG: Ferredoxin, 2Fe-2S [Pseudomonadota bacterium]|jgi:(2Fe-2S) ferredoxin